MADNKTAPGASFKTATREGTHSGELADMQVVGLATATGSDDAKTLLDVGATNPLPVYVPDVVVTGTITATDAVVAAPDGSGAFRTGASTAGSLVAAECREGHSTWTVQVTNRTTGVVSFEGSLDSTNGTDGNWIALNGVSVGFLATDAGFSFAGNGIYRGSTVGLKWFRARFTGSYTATPAIVIRLSGGPATVFLNGSIPTGTNPIGSVTNTVLSNAADTVNSAITAAHPVLDTRAILFAATSGGSYGNIERTNGGNLKVSVEESAVALPVTVTGAGTVSTLNSTTTNLAANGVFTGTSEDVSGYSNIAVSVFSSHVSATNGLSVQQSVDGTNWDFLDTYTVPATTGRTFNFGVAAKFYRLVYTNGATITTSLRIQTLYTANVKRGSSIRPQDARSNENDFEEVATYLNFYNGTDWDRARGSIANGLAVDVTRGPTLTKSTQGTTGFSVQDLKDAGRTHVNYYAVAAAAGTTTTETIITLTKSSGTSATSSATTHVPASGKRYRITSITFATRGHATATIQSTTFNVRINTAGAVTASSTPIVLSARSATPATASAWDRVSVPIPDGFEIVGDGTLQIGVSAAATYVTNAPTWDVLITGFEY